MRRCICALVALFFGASIANAQGVGGGTPIPLTTGKASCIDVGNYDVSMTLVSLQAKRTNGYWKQSKSLGGKFDVILTNDKNEKYSFPRGRALSAAGISGDIAFLPTTFSLLSKERLEQSGVAYKNVELYFYVINIEDKSAIAKTFSSFVDFSKTISLPANPFVDSAKLFGQFADKIIFDQINSQEDKNPVATFSYDLASSSDQANDCSATMLREEVNSVMFEPPKSAVEDGRLADGFLAVLDVSDYCFSYDPSRARVLYWKKSAQCSESPSAGVKPKPLQNPLLVIDVHKWTRKPDAAALQQAVSDARELPRAAAPLGVTVDALNTAVLDRMAALRVEGAFDKEALNPLAAAVNNGGSSKGLAEAIQKLKTINQSDAAKAIAAEAAVNLRACALAGVESAACN